jgi:hypothetical protein
MKKLLLLLLFIPIVSFGQDFSNIKNKIKYIKKFKSWEHFIDHFETRDQVHNFFGKPDPLKSYIGWGGERNLYGWESKEDYINHKKYYEIILNRYTRYSAASSSSSGNLSYNSMSNSLDYKGSTTYSEGGSYTYSYYFTFQFKKIDGPYNGGQKYRKPDIHRHSNIISYWEASNDMKGISDRKFISLIKKYYSKKTEEKNQFKRKR